MSEVYSGKLPKLAIKEKVVVNQKEKLINTAKELAWPKGTKSYKYHYPKGKPTKAFKKNLDKYCPNHKHWSPKPSRGVSCDVFVCVCVRASGLDKKFPRGLSEQVKHRSKNFKRIVKKNVRPIDIAKPGDIIMYYKSPGHTEHILIYGKKKIYEAQFHKANYGHTNSSLSKLKKKKAKVVILRPINKKKTVVRKHLRKGDTGTQVIRWQKFLKWYFDDISLNTGLYDDLTIKYTKKFQEKEIGKDYATGKVNEKTLAAARKIMK